MFKGVLQVLATSFPHPSSHNYAQLRCGSINITTYGYMAGVSRACPVQKLWIPKLCTIVVRKLLYQLVIVFFRQGYVELVPHYSKYFLRRQKTFEIDVSSLKYFMDVFSIGPLLSECTAYPM